MARHQELTVRAGEIELAGTLTLPDVEDEGARHPWVLLLPSWLPRDRDGGWDRRRHADWFAPVDDRDRGPWLLGRLAMALADHGIATYRYDKRGCGASGGRWEEADLFTQIDDARDAIGALRSQPNLDLRRCAVLGHGEGALLALSLAIPDSAISALSLVAAPARSLRDVLRRGAAYRARTGVDRQHPVVETLDDGLEELLEAVARRESNVRLPLAEDGGPIELGIAAWDQAIHTPGIALATMLHRSVGIVHGTADAWVAPDEAALLVAVLSDGGNSPGLERVEGAGHDLREADQAAIDRIASDLASRIERRELPPVLLAIEEMRDSG